MSDTAFYCRWPSEKRCVTQCYHCAVTDTINNLPSPNPDKQDWEEPQTFEEVAAQKSFKWLAETLIDQDGINEYRVNMILGNYYEYFVTPLQIKNEALQKEVDMLKGHKEDLQKELKSAMFLVGVREKEVEELRNDLHAMAIQWEYATSGEGEGLIAFNELQKEVDELKQKINKLENPVKSNY